MKKKVAIVNQRYGIEVNGGSEYYTRMLAERLQKDYEVEVLTTTALDYDTWAPYYPEGLQQVNQVNVRRFSVDKQRDIRYFSMVDRLIRHFPWLWRFLEPLWIRAQGPYCPVLIHYIKEHKAEFDVFIFVTYLYYTSLAGIPEVKEKAIFVPTAHDEYCIYFHIYRKLFDGIKGIVYLTGEEKNFVQQLYHNEGTPNRVAGTGIELPDGVDIGAFRNKYQIHSDYMVYVGRVETGKSCNDLFVYFARFLEKEQSDLKLVVAGKMMMEEPKHPAIRILGFIPEKDKYAAILGAKALIMPSAHESLSLVVLEAMGMGVPVIVNGASEVLEAHCKKSKAGVSYREYESFETAMKKVLTDSIQYEVMKEAGKQYVKRHYDWNGTVECYRELIEQ